MSVNIFDPAPNLRKLAEEINTQMENNPAQRAEFEALKTTLDRYTGEETRMSHIAAIMTLESNLAGDPKFHGNIRDLALKDPAALEKIITPAFTQPNSMKALVTKTAAESTVLNQAAPVAPVITPAATPEATPEPLQVATPPQQQAPQAEPQNTPPAAEADPVHKGTLAEKLVALASIPGYQDLMNRIEGNPHLQDMQKALLGDGDDPQAAEEAVNNILKRAGRTPEERRESTLFTGLVKTIDEKPGMISSIASSFSNDPKTGMMVMGVYSQFQQGFGSILDNLFGDGALDGIMQKLMGFIGQMFGQSGGLMALSNNGGQLVNKLMDATQSIASQVTLLDPDTGEANTKTGAQFQQDASAAAAAGAMTPEQRRLQQQNPGQTPGHNPGMTPQPVTN